MTAEQAAALQHLPAVLDALKALSADLEAARPLLQLFGVSPGQPGVPVNNGGPSTGSPAQTPGIIPWKVPPNGTPPQLTPEQHAAAAAQQAELEAWRNSPARTKLLEQVKPAAQDELPAEMTAAERKAQAQIFGKEFGQ